MTHRQVVYGRFAGSAELAYDARLRLFLFRAPAKRGDPAIGKLTSLAYRDGDWQCQVQMRNAADYEDIRDDNWAWPYLQGSVKAGQLLAVVCHDYYFDERHQLSAGPIPALSYQLRRAVLA